MSDADSSVPDGFRQIPGFPRYAIDKNGTILSSCKKGEQITKGGGVPWSKAKQLKNAISPSR